MNGALTSSNKRQEQNSRSQTPERTVEDVGRRKDSLDLGCDRIVASALGLLMSCAEDGQAEGGPLLYSWPGRKMLPVTALVTRAGR